MSANTLDWQLKTHDQLNANDVYALLALRSAVFVVEQKCIFQDIDGLDLTDGTWHLLAWQGDRLVGCLRVFDPSRHDGEVVIGRVATDASVRGSGVGHQLMEHALEHCAARWPRRSMYLSAQSHLAAFYARHGFVVVTNPYLEDGIPHVGMRRAGEHPTA
ncbi:MAG: GNAT family N-acetyltransferase [Dokdonella sp.]